MGEAISGESRGGYEAGMMLVHRVYRSRPNVQGTTTANPTGGWLSMWLSIRGTSAATRLTTAVTRFYIFQ